MPQNKNLSAPRKARRLSLSSAAWLRLRAEVLAAEPLCRACAARGLVVKATDVDHIANGEGDYSDDNSRANLQPLCRPCHSSKTARDLKRSSMGCDASGLPLDPAHHWNRERSPATDDGPNDGGSLLLTLRPNYETTQPPL